MQDPRRIAGNPSLSEGYIRLATPVPLAAPPLDAQV